MKLVVGRGDETLRVIRRIGDDRDLTDLIDVAATYYSGHDAVDDPRMLVVHPAGYVGEFDPEAGVSMETLVMAGHTVVFSWGNTQVAVMLDFEHMNGPRVPLGKN